MLPRLYCTATTFDNIKFLSHISRIPFHQLDNLCVAIQICEITFPGSSLFIQKRMLISCGMLWDVMGSMKSTKVSNIYITTMNSHLYYY